MFSDRIADIRREASVLLATILGRFVDAEESMLIEHNPQMMTTTQSFVDDIVKGFALSVRWLRRQTYVFLPSDHIVIFVCFAIFQLCNILRKGARTSHNARADIR